MKKIISIVIIIFCFSACRTARPTFASNITKTDSTSTKVTYQKKLDTFTVAADSLKISVPIADLSEKPILAKSKSGRTSGSVRKVNNNIEVECFTDKYEKIIESQNKIIETLMKLTEVRETTVTETEFKTPWYMKGLAAIGGLVFTAVLIMLGIKFIKPF